MKMPKAPTKNKQKIFKIDSLLIVCNTLLNLMVESSLFIFKTEIEKMNSENIILKKLSFILFIKIKSPFIIIELIYIKLVKQFF